jgi:hypothetical protein
MLEKGVGEVLEGSGLYRVGELLVLEVGVGDENVGKD